MIEQRILLLEQTVRVLQNELQQLREYILQTLGTFADANRTVFESLDARLSELEVSGEDEPWQPEGSSTGTEL